MKHNFHLVNSSPWPLTSSIGVFGLTVGSALCMHSIQNGFMILFLGISSLIFTLFLWWRDIIRESTYEGFHTIKVQKGLRLGMILFISTEVMFFFAFFWGYFHSSLAPTVDIGSVWPPRGIDVFNPWHIPLLNTMVLVLSGFTITWSHFSILFSNYEQINLSLGLTLLLAVFFTGLQLCEYIDANFSISDSIYGTTFFMSTGFHGFHVIIGTLFIFVCFCRNFFYHFTKKHHLGFECAAWYWHFVDVVWLFLFLVIYWWGNSSAAFYNCDFFFEELFNYFDFFDIDSIEDYIIQEDKKNVFEELLKDFVSNNIK